MLTFDADFVEPFIDTRRLVDNSEIVPVTYLLRSNNAEDLEGKVLHLRCLSVTVGGGTKTANLSYIVRNQNNNRSRRVNEQSPFNRYFLFACVANPPNIVAVLTRNSNESNELLMLTKGQTIVGSDFYLVEPEIITRYLGETTPLLDTANKKLIPLRQSVINRLPAAANTNIDNLRPGQGAWFCLKNTSISLSRVSLFLNTSCNGNQCDRQKERGQCTCLFTTGSTGQVHSFDVAFDAPMSVQASGRIVVHGFKSLRTTKLFFLDFEERNVDVDNEISNQHLLRPRFRNMVDCINLHGGWTMCGWTKLGEMTNQANGQEKVGNYETKIHITYLHPTRRLTTSTITCRGMMMRPNEPREPVRVANAQRMAINVDDGNQEEQQDNDQQEVQVVQPVDAQEQQQANEEEQVDDEEDNDQSENESETASDLEQVN